MYYVIFFTSYEIESCKKIKGVKSMGFLEILTLIFIVLKLFGIITWSWWLVVLPEIIASIIYIIAIILFLKARREFWK